MQLMYITHIFIVIGFPSVINNGFILEFGRLSKTNQDTNTTVTLPKALTTALYIVILTCYNSSTSGGQQYLNGNAAHSFTKTNFKILEYDYGRGVSWLVIGK